MVFMDRVLRKKLSKPYGKVYKSKSLLLKLLSKPHKKLITIGDESTYSIISLGHVPSLAIFDRKIKRKPTPKKYLELIYSNSTNLIKVSNVAGSISPELFRAIKDSLKKNKKIFIEVDGEEDLATLVVLIFCSKKDFVFYGQPNRGIVFLDINKKNKEFAKKILKKLLKK